MPTNCFTTEIKDGIAHLRFCRPDEFNSFIPEFWQQLPAEVNNISETAAARVIVLSAEGKHFTSGMDISVFMTEEFQKVPDNRQVAAETMRYFIQHLQETFSALENARQPVLAAVQGGAIGAGVDLITACDCRYASEDAFFCVQETAIGMTADVGTFPRLAKVIPEGWARQMAYTAERLPAAKALQIGLVNQVFPHHEGLVEGVMAIAAKIAEHSPLAVTGSKRMINYARDHSTPDTLDYISLWNAAMLRPEDMMEYFTAKGQKRKAVFDELSPKMKMGE